MNDNIGSGDIPHEMNVIIEIPANSSPIKYEVDKESGMLFVDRFISMPMFYPCNYGFIPKTLADDGDPVDVLVLTPHPLIHHCVVKCRPVGMLRMTDESGVDVKVLAVPLDKMGADYQDIQDIDDVSDLLLKQIELFFTYYKHLEKDKWVKVEKWVNRQEAMQEIKSGVDNYSS